MLPLVLYALEELLEPGLSAQIVEVRVARELRVDSKDLQTGF